MSTRMGKVTHEKKNVPFTVNLIGKKIIRASYVQTHPQIFQERPGSDMMTLRLTLDSGDEFEFTASSPRIDYKTIDSEIERLQEQVAVLDHDRKYLLNNINILKNIKKKIRKGE